LFFDPQRLRVHGEMARALGVADGNEVLYYPRRGFDLWNTRYFLVPILPEGWTSPGRGYAAMLTDSERIYPDRRRLEERGPDSWSQRQDWQVLRHQGGLPRARAPR